MNTVVTRIEYHDLFDLLDQRIGEIKTDESDYYRASMKFKKITDEEMSILKNLASAASLVKFNQFWVNPYNGHFDGEKLVFDSKNDFLMFLLAFNSEN